MLVIVTFFIAFIALILRNIKGAQFDQKKKNQEIMCNIEFII